MKAVRLVAFMMISLVAAGPFGGFVFGFLTCSDCGWNIFGRLFIGCVMAVLTPLSGGFPPRNEGGVGEPFNAWPHIVMVGFVVFAVLVYRDIKKQKQE